MIRLAGVVGTALSVMPVGLAAQAADFTVLRHGDTVAVERFTRERHTLDGSLTRSTAANARERVRYQVTVLEDGTTPLLELSAWRAEDPPDAPARQTTRVIFKDDSVAVDEVSRSAGIRTVVFPTAVAAVPYLNLSMAFLEQATRRWATAHRDSLAVPFFNLGGGQTVIGAVRRLGVDSVLLGIGPVEFRLRVDPEGRILGGALPSQDLIISQEAAH